MDWDLKIKEREACSFQPLSVWEFSVKTLAQQQKMQIPEWGSGLSLKKKKKEACSVRPLSVGIFWDNHSSRKCKCHRSCMTWDLKCTILQFTMQPKERSMYLPKKKMISRVQKQSKLRYNHSNYSQVIDLTALSFNESVWIEWEKVTNQLEFPANSPKVAFFFHTQLKITSWSQT